MKFQKKSTLSKKYTLSIAFIYSILIISISISFNFVMKKNSKILEDALTLNSHDILLDKVEIIIEQLNKSKAHSIKKIINTIHINATIEKDFLYTIIFSKTTDENYFKMIEKIPISKEFNFNINKNAVVQEEKDINYLKKGLMNGIVEPKIYSNENFRWQNVYYPYKFKNKTIVLQFIISTARTDFILYNYSNAIKKIRWLMVIITLILVIAVITLTLLFTQNFSLLIKNLSTYLKKAASGDLELNLNTESDADLQQLALSFNSLMDELKDKKDKNNQDPEPMANIFAMGVSYLKENKLEETITIFKAILLIKPGGFGSYFNLGVAYAKLKDYDNSLKMFEKALEANPSFEITEKYIEKVKRLCSSHG